MWSWCLTSPKALQRVCRGGGRPALAGAVQAPDCSGREKSALPTPQQAPLEAKLVRGIHLNPQETTDMQGNLHRNFPIQDHAHLSGWAWTLAKRPGVLQQASGRTTAMVTLRAPELFALPPWGVTALQKHLLGIAKPAGSLGQACWACAAGCGWPPWQGNS